MTIATNVFHALCNHQVKYGIVVDCLWMQLELIT